MAIRLINPPGGAGTGSSGHIIEDEGVSVPDRERLDFRGGGVAVSNNVLTSATEVSIAAAAIGSSIQVDQISVAGSVVFNSTGATITFTSTGSLVIAAGATAALTFDSAGNASFTKNVFVLGSFQASNVTISGTVSVAGTVQLSGASFSGAVTVGSAGVAIGTTVDATFVFRTQGNKAIQLGFASVAPLSDSLATNSLTIYYTGASNLQFVVKDGASVVTDIAIGSTNIAGSGHTIQDEGTSVPDRTFLNFKGAGVTVSDNAVSSITEVSIPAFSLASSVQVDQISVAGSVVFNSTGAGITFTSTGSLTIFAGASAALTFNSTGAASFAKAVVMAGSLNVSGGIQASNASAVSLTLSGSASIAGTVQLSAASISGAIVASNAQFVNASASGNIVSGGTITGSALSVTTLVSAANAVLGSLTVTSGAQFSAASFTGAITASTITAVALNASTITATSSVTLASIVVFPSTGSVLFSINGSVVFSFNSVPAFNMAGNLGATNLGVNSINASLGTFVVGVNINAATVSHLIVTSTAQFSASSFAGAVTVAGSVNITGGLQTSNASATSLTVSGTASFAGTTQLSIASFSGQVTANNIDAQGATFHVAVVATQITVTLLGVSGAATFGAAVHASTQIVEASTISAAQGVFGCLVVSANLQASVIVAQSLFSAPQIAITSNLAVATTIDATWAFRTGGNTRSAFGVASIAPASTSLSTNQLSIWASGSSVRFDWKDSGSVMINRSLTSSVGHIIQSLSAGVQEASVLNFIGQLSATYDSVGNKIQVDVGATPANLYVSPNGLDSNTGINSSAPLLTIQAAVNKIPKLFGGNCVIHIASGTYNQAVVIDGIRPSGPYTLTLRGYFNTTAGSFTDVAHSSGTCTGSTTSAFPKAAESLFNDTTTSLFSAGDVNGWLEITSGPGYVATSDAEGYKMHNWHLIEAFNSVSQIGIVTKWTLPTESAVATAVPASTTTYRVHHNADMTTINGCDVRAVGLEIINTSGIILQKIRFTNNYDANCFIHECDRIPEISTCMFDSATGVPLRGYGLRFRSSFVEDIKSCLFKGNRLEGVVLHNNTAVENIFECMGITSTVNSGLGAYFSSTIRRLYVFLGRSNVYAGIDVEQNFNTYNLGYCRLNLNAHGMIVQGNSGLNYVYPCSFVDNTIDGMLVAKDCQVLDNLQSGVMADVEIIGNTTNGITISYDGYVSAISSMTFASNGTNVSVTGMFFDDANSRVGISTNTPSAIFHIRKDQNAGTKLLIENLAGGASVNPNLEVKCSAGSLFMQANPTTYTVVATWAAHGIIYSTLTSGIIMAANPGPIKFSPGGLTPISRMDASGFSVGADTPAAADLDVSGDFAIRTAALSVANGSNNHNVNAVGVSMLRLFGPTLAFGITGFSGGVNGKVLNIWNNTGQNMAIFNQNAGSSVGNRIITMTGGSFVTSGDGFAQFVYWGTTNAWIMTAFAA